MRGIGVVNLVHSHDKDTYLIDYRIYASDTDGKTKNHHFKDMLMNAVANKQIKAKTVLFDSWYGAWQNLKLVNSLGLIFYTTLKNNRLVSLSKESGYIHLNAIDWTEQRLLQGVIVKLKKVPFNVKLFKLVATNGDIDWIITNDLDDNLTTPVVKATNDWRWRVEAFHREIKQLTGSEKCQCRKARSQRNHLACCYLVWLSLKMVAKKTLRTLYQVRNSLFSDFLKQELRSPRIQAFCGK